MSVGEFLGGSGGVNVTCIKEDLVTRVEGQGEQAALVVMSSFDLARADFASSRVAFIQLVNSFTVSILDWGWSGSNPI